MITETIRPDNFLLDASLKGSPLNNRKQEILASHIIRLGRQNANKWQPFTSETLQSICHHNFQDCGQEVLDQLVTSGLLDFEDDHYRVNDKFIEALWKFVVHHDDVKQTREKTKVRARA